MREIKKLLLGIILCFINLICWGQDSISINYGSTEAGYITVTSTSVTTGDTTITSSYTGFNSLGASPDGGWPSNLRYRIYSADSVVSTISVGGVGFPWSYVNMKIYNSENFVTNRLNTIYINYDSLTTLDIGTNSTVYEYTNIPVQGDSLRITVKPGGVYNAALNFVVITEGQAPAWCDIDTLEASAVITDDWNNGGTGAIDQTVNSGSLNVTHSWSNGATTEDLTGLFAGNYTDTITSDSNCVLIKEYTVLNLTACDTINDTIHVTITDAYGADGKIVIDSITGEGTGPYTYLWNTSETVDSIYNKTAGDYSVTVTDANTCETVDTFTIAQLNPCDTVGIIITGDVTDAGDTLGSINLTITGNGTPPYTYLWSNGDTTQNVDSLQKGQYVVVVTDANSCQDSATFTVIGDGTATFYADFEDQTIEPEIGEDYWFLETGTSGSFNLIANPLSSDFNTSNYVLAVSTNEGTGGRAEYTAGRLETDGKKYIYTWKRYHPVGMWVDIDMGFCLLNQWKTWPCESGGTGAYAKYDTLICSGSGVFNDSQYLEDEITTYRSRANPNCNSDFSSILEGFWHKFVLEVYWTNSEEGYYRIWRNDTLFGYSDNMKTLFDEFPENGSCDLNWTTGLYTAWWPDGGLSQDSLTAYIDDIAIYDIDSGFTINSVCPDCEVAPAVPVDSSVYRVNINRSFAEDDGFNNYIVSWNGDTNSIDISNTYGQNKGFDVYLSGPATSTGGNTLSDDCFPSGVIVTSVSWTGVTTQEIQFKQLDTASTYTFRLLSATSNISANAGVQIWTTEGNRDTVLASLNLCDMAEITNLKPNSNGDLTINSATVSGGSGYINSFELIEYPSITYCDTVLFSASAITTDAYTNEGAIDQTVVSPQSVTHKWNDGPTTKDRIGLISGVYTDSIIMADSGCVLVKSYTINQLNPCDTTTILIDSISSVLDTLIDGVSQETGALTISVSGGDGSYSYSWNSGAYTTQNLNGVSYGVYNITVTDGNSCTGNNSFTILSYDSLACKAFVVNDAISNTVNNNDNGTIDLTISGGYSPHTYLWSDGPTTKNRSGLSAGDYTITITDDNTCDTVLTYSILQLYISSLDTIKVGEDITLRMWSIKINLGIDEYNVRTSSSLEKVNVDRQETYKEWCYKVNRFREEFPEITTDSLNYNNHNLGIFRLKSNEVIYKEGVTD